jgi:hypothetical protein
MGRLCVFWFKKMYFLDGCDAIIINDEEAQPSRNNLLLGSIFIGTIIGELSH